MWWGTLLVLALRRQRQADSKFKASLVYRGSSRTARAHRETLSLKTKENQPPPKTKHQPPKQNPFCFLEYIHIKFKRSVLRDIIGSSLVFYKGSSGNFVSVCFWIYVGVKCALTSCGDYLCTSRRRKWAIQLLCSTHCHLEWTVSRPGVLHCLWPTFLALSLSISLGWNIFSSSCYIDGRTEDAAQWIGCWSRCLPAVSALWG